MERLMLLIFLITATLCHEPFQVIFEWKSIDFHWSSDDDRQIAVKFCNYIEKNNFIVTARFWKDKMYLTLPRWKDGVPVTLAVTSAIPINGTTAPKLEAFPSWSMQKLGDCSALQNVHGIEIDPKGRMWALDNGKPTFLRESAICGPRLVIFDLEDDGNVLRSYRFPEHVAHREKAYLNDIVLDHEDGGMAYISDSGSDPGIIVFSLKDGISWKIRHDSMKAKAEAVRFMVANTHVINPVNIDGIALSPASDRDRQVYYSPLSSFHLYSIPVSALKNNESNINEYVKELGRKTSQSDGMIMSSTGVLYFGLLADDAIAMWDTKNTASFTTGQRIISRDHVLTQWPDSFAFDEDGNLWCVTNKIQNFLNNRVDINEPNYRLIRSRIGIKSYQYYENGTAPELPDITAGIDSIRSVFTVVLSLIILVFVVK